MLTINKLYQKSKNYILKNNDEIKKINESCIVVAEILAFIKEYVNEGISTYEIDKIIENKIYQYNAKPSFKGYCGYPACTCISVNEQVVHGIPSTDKVILNGDIVSIDLGVNMNGYHGDSAITIPVGTVSTKKNKLIETTHRSLMLAIDQMIIGNRIMHISRTIQDHAESQGFSVVRQYVGHGIGKKLHEDPEIPNYVRSGLNQRLLAGMVLAIEPMINFGSYEVSVLNDGWTVVTNDGMDSAHFEHTVAITKDGPLILSLL